MKCKHPDKKIKRIREYIGGDCWGYSAECQCGFLITGFSKQECEEGLDKARKEVKIKCNTNNMD